MFGFSFLAPLALALFPLATAALVYAYLKSNRARQLPISSLFLFQQIKKKPLQAKKLKLPPRFFIELLICLLIAIFIAGVLRSGPQSSVAIVIDNSLGSATLQPAHSGSLTALDLMKDSAKNYLQTLSDQQRVDIFTTAPASRKLNQSPLSHSQARSELESIETSWASSDLSRTISEIARGSHYKEVSIFSLAKSDRPLLSGEHGKIQLSSVFERSDLQNIAILDLRATTTDSQGFIQLEVVLQAFTREDAPVELHLLRGEQQGARLEFSPLRLQRAVLPANRPHTVSFEGVPADSSIKVELKATNPSQNSLLLDDTAWFVQQTAKASLDFISPMTLLESGLDRLDRFSFNHISPENYSHSDRGNVSIFHRYVPERLPDSASIFIAPPGSAPHFATARTTANPQITVVEESHPLMQYLNFQLLNLNNFTALKSPAWAETIINTDSGSAMLAGTTRGNRVAIVGFELLPYLGEADRVLSILTLNLLSWISAESSILSNSPRPFDRITLPEGTTEIVDQTGIRLPVQQGATLVRAERPGILSFREQGELQVLSAVNAFYPQESNLLEPRVITLPTLRASQVEAADSTSTNWWQYLLYLILILLFLDLLLFELFRRRAHT